MFRPSTLHITFLALGLTQGAGISEVILTDSYTTGQDWRQVSAGPNAVQERAAVGIGVRRLDPQGRDGRREDKASKRAQAFHFGHTGQGQRDCST